MEKTKVLMQILPFFAVFLIANGAIYLFIAISSEYSQIEGLVSGELFACKINQCFRVKSALEQKSVGLVT